MNIIICEDLEEDAVSLSRSVEKYFYDINGVADISVYNNGDALLEDFAAGKINNSDIIFLDIYMPGTDGVETAKKIRETDKNIVIVFTTTSRDHSLEGYSVYAFQYLVKPVAYPEVKTVLDKCMERFADSARFIEVISGRLKVKICLKDIIYIESFKTELHIHTADNTVKTFLRLFEIEKQLENSTFLRTQRSYIVNMRYIKKMTAAGFLLINDKLIPFRKNDKLTVKQAYMDYMFALSRGRQT